jgi:hypothetical protein
LVAGSNPARGASNFKHLHPNECAEKAVIYGMSTQFAFGCLDRYSQQMVMEIRNRGAREHRSGRKRCSPGY